MLTKANEPPEFPAVSKWYPKSELKRMLPRVGTPMLGWSTNSKSERVLYFMTRAAKPVNGLRFLAIDQSGRSGNFYIEDPDYFALIQPPDGTVWK